MDEQKKEIWLIRRLCKVMSEAKVVNFGVGLSVVIGTAGLLICIAIMEAFWSEFTSQPYYLAEGVIIAYGSGMISTMSFLARWRHSYLKEIVCHAVITYGIVAVLLVVGVVMALFATHDLEESLAMVGRLFLVGAAVGVVVYGICYAIEPLEEVPDDLV